MSFLPELLHKVKHSDVVKVGSQPVTYSGNCLLVSAVWGLCICVAMGCVFLYLRTVFCIVRDCVFV